jgi:nucleoid-associated protein YgaU
MTRETKIGLLVGLAFIIVIGILLSDHINTTSDPARAQLTGAYDNVTNSVNAPGTERGNDRTTAVVVPNRVEPPIPVRTEREIPQPVRGGGATVVDIQPGGDPSQLRLTQNGGRVPEPQAPTNDNVQISPPDNNAGNTEVTQSNPTNPNVAGRLQEEARKHNEELVPPGSGNDPVGIHGGLGSNGGTPAVSGAPRATLPAGFREVKAEQNDSVSRLAAKYLGTSNKATREAIIRANPSLAAEPHMVIAGKTYIIPPFAAAAAGQPVAPQPQQQQPPVAQRPQAPAPQPGVTYYTVKENDNLWRIAAEQLGSGARWTEIRDLNQDVLKGGEGLQLNMRLKLPAKTVASNN